MQDNGEVIIANQVALEAVSNIRVVAAYSLHESVVQRYSKVLHHDMLVLLKAIY